MSISVTCSCGKALNVPDSFAGKKGKCPHCKTVLDIPAQGEAPGAKTETKEVEQVEFRCPKTGKRARLPKALAGASVVCPICGEVHSISKSERLKDFISFSTVVKEEEEAEEPAAEGVDRACPSCGKPIAAVKEMCMYCGARLSTGSVRARGLLQTEAVMRTSASAVVSVLVAAGAVGLWFLGRRGGAAGAGVLAVLAGGWGVIAVRGAVRPLKGETLAWMALICGLVVAVAGSIAASMRTPAAARRLAPLENTEGLGEVHEAGDGSFSFRPLEGMKEVVPSFVLGYPDPRAVAAMRGERGTSLAVLSYYEPPRPRPTEAELEHFARELFGTRETFVWELVDAGGVETHVFRKMEYSETRKTASHVVHVLFYDRPGTVPAERLRREFIVSTMRFSPEYMKLMHEEALARGEEKKALSPQNLEKERIRRIEEECGAGQLSKEEARELKEAKALSEAELGEKVLAWAKEIRRVVHILYIHDLPLDAARRRRNSRKLIYPYAAELLTEIATGETSVDEARDRFAEEVQLMARAMEKLGGRFTLSRRSLRSWFSKLADGADEGPKARSRAKLAGRMAARVRSKAASSGLDRQVGKLGRLDLNLALDEEWVELFMKSVSTFKFKRAGEPAEE